MKCIGLALGALLLIISCVPDNKTGDTLKIYSDQEYREKIIGYWVEEAFPFGQAAFLEDGIYKEWVYEDQTKEKLLVEIEGRWWVEGGYLFNELTKLIPKIEGFEIGDVAVDKIVEISGITMTLIDESGESYKQFRQK